MLNSDPSPKATSVPPTTFKEGDKVRMKSNHYLTGKVVQISDYTGDICVANEHGTQFYPPENFELVPDVAPSPSFREGDIAIVESAKTDDVCRCRGEYETCEVCTRPSPFNLGDRDREPVKLLDVPYAPDKEKWKAAANNVDRPSHYTAGGIETITAIEAMVGQAGWSPLTGYRLGNVLKYLWRHAAKGGVESLKKARWYLDREIEAQEAGK